MKTQITIIGLGEIGCSIGLALANYADSMERIGTDLKNEAEKKALEIQAVDRTCHNLYEAVEKADIIVLAMPGDGAKQTLEWIGHDIKESAVILDFSPCKQASADYAKQYLVNPARYIGLWAGCSAKCLPMLSRSSNTACKDCFTESTVFICPESDTAEDAIDMTETLIEDLGAEHYFTNPAELDGIIASTYILPSLISTALMNSLSTPTSWQDTQRAAGKPAFHAVEALTSYTETEVPSFAALQNRENTIRSLNSFITELKQLRDEISTVDEDSLNADLNRAEEARAKWLEKTDRAVWEGVPGQAGFDIIKGSLLGGLLRKKK